MSTPELLSALDSLGIVTALHLQDFESQNAFQIGSGCPSIDSLLKCKCAVSVICLRGGVRSGFLTEVYGEAGSGKTQFAMLTMLHVRCVSR